jgi:hypothetical protein
MPKIRIKLQKKWGEYAAGDTVSFDERKGRPLIANGTGVLVGKNIETADMKRAQADAKAKAKAEADAKRKAEQKAKSRAEAEAKAKAEAEEKAKAEAEEKAKAKGTKSKKK